MYKKGLNEIQDTKGKKEKYNREKIFSTWQSPHMKKKPTATNVLNGKKKNPKIFSLRLGTRQVCPLTQHSSPSPSQNN